MSVGAGIFAFFLGFFFARRLNCVNPVFVALVGSFVALGLGNYPGYSISGISITFVFALIGIILGNWREK